MNHSSLINSHILVCLAKRLSGHKRMRIAHGETVGHRFRVIHLRLNWNLTKTFTIE